eukprot:scaffold121892_cov45-Phaeocystis_antarctica.AAC.1
MYFPTLSRRRLPPTLRPPPRDPRDRRVLSPHSCPHRGQPGRENAAPASGVVVGVDGGVGVVVVVVGGRRRRRQRGR